MRIPLIAGNWKMYKTKEEALVFAEEFKEIYRASHEKVAICAPFIHLESLIEAFKGTGIKVGAQNMHFKDQGAFTGEISGLMLKAMGVDYCIIGHSERRQYFNETDETINKKLHAAFNHGIIPILCVGEVLEERDGGLEYQVVRGQLEKDLTGLGAEQISALVIAYEPIWAIGTGRTASPKQANEMCGYIRKVISELYSKDIAHKIIIQYGGSVKPENANQLMTMEEIDGALVGGASLVPKDLLNIINF